MKFEDNFTSAFAITEEYGIITNVIGVYYVFMRRFSNYDAANMLTEASRHGQVQRLRRN
jgi:hypothetical protein